MSEQSLIFKEIHKISTNTPEKKITHITKKLKIDLYVIELNKYLIPKQFNSILFILCKITLTLSFP